MAFISGVISNASEANTLVVLLLSSDHSYVDEVLSDTGTGAYEFTALPSTIEFDVIAYDPDYPEGGALIFSNVVSFAIAGAHRYWKMDAFTTPSNLLEISELQLFQAGVRVDSSATYTGSADTVGGTSFPNLHDGNLTTSYGWASASTIFFKMDFGASNEQNIDGVKQGGFDNAARFFSAFTLSFSDDDSSYTVLGNETGITYPGDFTLSSLYTVP